MVPRVFVQQSWRRIDHIPSADFPLWASPLSSLHSWLLQPQLSNVSSSVNIPAPLHVLALHHWINQWEHRIPTLQLEQPIRAYTKCLLGNWSSKWDHKMFTSQVEQPMKWQNSVHRKWYHTNPTGSVTSYPTWCYERTTCKRTIYYTDF